MQLDAQDWPGAQIEDAPAIIIKDMIKYKQHKLCQARGGVQFCLFMEMPNFVLVQLVQIWMALFHTMIKTIRIPLEIILLLNGSELKFYKPDVRSLCSWVLVSHSLCYNKDSGTNHFHFWLHCCSKTKLFHLFGWETLQKKTNLTVTIQILDSWSERQN